MKIKGIKRGKFIELLEETSLEDGTQVSVEVPDSHPDSTVQLKQAEISFAEATQEFIGCLDSNLEDLSHIAHQN